MRSAPKRAVAALFVGWLASATAGLAQVPSVALGGVSIQIEGSSSPWEGDASEARIFLDPGPAGPITMRPLHAGTQLPPGVWSWHVEGEGWITLPGADLRLEGGKPAPTLVARAVLACDISLSQNATWQKVAFIEVFAQDHHFSYRVDLRQRSRFEVPRGAFGLAFYGASGLMALSERQHCDGSSVSLLEAPSLLPQVGHESTLVRLRIPPGIDAPLRVRFSFQSVGSSPLPTVIAPTFSMESPREIVAAFVERETRPVEFVASGDKVKSVRELLAESDRAVREMRLDLQPRAVLSADVDFRPSRRHAEADLQLLRCFDREADEFLIRRLVSRGECLLIGEQKLSEGARDYRFPGLDTGAYVLGARIDGEQLSSIEWPLVAVIRPEDAESGLSSPWQLREMEIFGQILENGAPVSGVVRVAGLFQNTAVARDLPTDGDLTYHWYFFGRPFRNDRGDFPWKADSTSKKDAQLLGPPSWSRVTACLQDGACFAVASEAYFVGQGRFDVQVPQTRCYSFSVLDAASEAPIQGAKVVVTGRAQSLAFKDGEIRRLQAPGFFDAFETDERGEVKLRPYPEDGLGVIVTKLGYANQSLRFAELKAGMDPIEIRLRPSPDSIQGTILRDAEGVPLANARAVVIGDRGDGPAILCAARATDRGILSLPSACARNDQASVLLVHPRIGLALAETADLEGQVELRLDNPRSRLTVRLVDGAGQPLSARPCRLGLGAFSLPDSILWLLRNELAIPDLVSDERGEIQLSFLPEAGDWFLQVASPDPRGEPASASIITSGRKRSAQELTIE